MSEDDKKLPVPRRDTVPSEYRDVSPPRRTVLGYVVGGVASRIKGRSLRKHQEEVDALNDLEKAKGQLADTKTETDRKIARYVFDRDKLIADDRDQTDHDIELGKIRRREELAAAQARSEQALDSQVRAQQTREFSQVLGPLKTKRGQELFEAGNYDAAAALRDARQDYEGAAPPVPPAASQREQLLAGLERAKATILDQLQNTRARGGNTIDLELTLGRLQADIEQIKDQPG